MIMIITEILIYPVLWAFLLWWEELGCALETESLPDGKNKIFNRKLFIGVGWKADVLVSSDLPAVDGSAVRPLFPYGQSQNSGYWGS